MKLLLLVLLLNPSEKYLLVGPYEEVVFQLYAGDSLIGEVQTGWRKKEKSFLFGASHSPVVPVPTEVDSFRIMNSRFYFNPFSFQKAELLSGTTFMKKIHNSQLWMTAFIAVIAALLVYNFSIGVSSKDKGYLWFCAYLLTMMLQWPTLHGYTAVYLFQADFFWLGYLPWAIIVIQFVVVVKFALEYLQTDLFDRKVYNRYHLSLFPQLVLGLGLCTISIKWAIGVTFLLPILTFVFILPLWFLAKKNHYEPRKYFLYAFSTMIASAILSVCAELRILTKTVFTQHYQLIGVVIMALILGGGLAQKLSWMQAEMVKLEKTRYTLEQNKLLLRELDHRILNNLQVVQSVLHGTLRKVKTPEAKYALEEGKARVQALYRLQQKLQGKKMDNFINVSVIIGSLIKDFETSKILERDYSFQMDLEPLHLPSAKCTKLAMVVNEGFLNSIKHADAEFLLIQVKIVNSRDFWKLVLHDNGVITTLPLESTAGQGSFILNEMSKQLGGTLEKSIENGLKLELVVPHEA